MAVAPVAAADVADVAWLWELVATAPTIAALCQLAIGGADLAPSALAEVARAMVERAAAGVGSQEGLIDGFALLWQLLWYHDVELAELLFIFFPPEHADGLRRARCTAASGRAPFRWPPPASVVAPRRSPSACSENKKSPPLGPSDCMPRAAGTR